MSAVRPTGAVYEISVAGGVGPALRAALDPGRGAPPHYETIARAMVSGDGDGDGEADPVDLVDLVRLLELRGLELTGVTVVVGGHAD
jgi:hypothetical protein